MSALTLYAIADVRPRGALGKGLGGRPLSIVRAAGAHVVVERAPSAAVSERALRAYDRIVRRVARAAPAVLPVRFGTTVADAAALGTLLAPLRKALGAALDVVRGCVQYTLRVYGRPAPPPPSDPRAGPGARFMAKRMAARRAPEVAPVAEATAPFVRASRVERHDDRRAGRPLATVYHLVARGDVRAYRIALERGARTLDGVRLVTTGPWPPYAFAELP